MGQYYAYVRVSTARQGERGVSLQEQKDAILRYSQSRGLGIARWFEERETAAASGRPTFGQMMRLLKAGLGQGVIIHKIDRSARNLRDWADLGELIDVGVEVHFANESLDLNSRGGRLSADIQAVVAADYIRNLREETRKGFFGRLKQGLLPRPAPLGYLNCGGGKPKVVDPIAAPLVREVFSLYASGNVNFRELLQRAHAIGLRGRGGKALTKNGLSKLLNNPFYAGVIRVQKTGEVFDGVHEPLITPGTFERVQDIIHGRLNARSRRHDFLLRKRLTCSHCGYHLIGELHKRRVYYRCQTKACPVTTIREDRAEDAIRQQFEAVMLSEPERQWCTAWIRRLTKDTERHRRQAADGLRLKLRQGEERLTRLTDAYLDGAVDRDDLEQRKTALLMERRSMAERLAELDRGISSPAAEFERFLERANSAWTAYNLANVAEKRDLVDAVTSNCIFDGESLEVVLKSPFDLLASRPKSECGSPSRDTHRTFLRIFGILERQIQADGTGASASSCSVPPLARLTPAA